MNRILLIILLVSTGLFTQAQQSSTDSDDQIFTAIEIQAEFVGGRSAMNRFIAKNLIYPEKALEKKVGGTVFVDVIIDKDGNVKNPVIAKGKELECGLPEEALRVVSRMPKWKPAMREVKPGPRKQVESMQRIAVVFDIAKFQPRER